MYLDLTHHVALVFCASGTISSAVARAFHAAGATVVLTARRPAEAERLRLELGLADPIYPVDVLDESSVTTVLTEVYRVYGRLDSVFNGVGPRAQQAGYGQLATELTLPAFRSAFDLIVGGQFVTGRAAARVWAASGTTGTLVLLSSSLARLKLAGMSGLAAASAAVEGLTRSFAAELAPLGCRAVCINATALAGTRSILETSALQAARLGVSADMINEGMARGGLLGRTPTPAQVADLIVFAASEFGIVLNSHVIDADCGTASVL